MHENILTVIAIHLEGESKGKEMKQVNAFLDRASQYGANT